MIIRPARVGDQDAIRAINLAAFPTSGEADLVDELRADADLLAELVAEADDVLVGCIQFSRLALEGDATVEAAALAPMAVRPDMQRRGVGGALIRAGVEACRILGLEAIVVLGHPEYYPRFGFSADAARLIHDPFGAGPAFMALALRQGALDQPTRPRYAPAFQIPTPD